MASSHDILIQLATEGEINEWAKNKHGPAAPAHVESKQAEHALK